MNRWIAVSGFLLFALVAGAGLAQSAGADVVWDMAAGAEGLPTEVEAGYTTFAIRAAGEQEATLTLYRLKEGTSAADLEAAVHAIGESFRGQGDTVAAINHAFDLADAVGETGGRADHSPVLGVALSEGRYALEASVSSEESTELTYHLFEVTGEAGRDAPEADASVSFVDFAFALPADLRAGPQLWEVTNRGEQAHHMVLFRLHEGRTMDEFQAWFESEGQGDPVADEAGYVGITGPGETVYAEMDLSAGAYVAVCFLPDHRGEASGRPHFMLGMMQTFTVAAE